MEYDILMIDDDIEICELTQKYLQTRGNYQVDIAHNFGQARAKISENSYKIYILDVLMGEESGINFLNECREKANHTPIIMLSALSQPDDRINGLASGANDYLGKPFDPRELVLRIQGLISRFEAPKTLEFGDNIYDYGAKKLFHQNKLIVLTTTESAIFDLLATNIGQAQTREFLCQSVVGAHNNPRVIDVHIASLRRKIHDKSEFIQSVRHLGYMLKP